MAYTRTYTIDASPSGDTVKAAIATKLDGDLTDIYTHLTTHEAMTTNAHGVGSGTIVGTALTQTLTNKTLTSPTISGGTASSMTIETPTLSGTLSGGTISGVTMTATITASGATFVSPTITGGSSTNMTITTPTITGTVTASGATIVSPTVTGGTFPNPTFSGTITGLPSSSKWQSTTDFNDQPASTSTITMTSDLTASIKPGMAIKFKLSGTYYYAICTAIAAGLLTIAGAPLTTGDGDLTELYYSNLHGQVIQIPILVPGYFADANETTLLLNDNLEYLKWCQSKAYLVMMSATQKVADTGAENTVNCSIAGSNVFSTALTLSATAGTWVDTVVAVTTANYDINFGEAIELVVTKVGNGDCTDLSVILTFVGE